MQEAYGKRFVVTESRNGDTIGELKAKFEAEYGVKAEHQELVAGGKTFGDEDRASANVFHLRLLHCPSEYWWMSTPGKLRPTWEQGLAPRPDISAKAHFGYQSPYEVIGGGHTLIDDNGKKTYPNMPDHAKAYWRAKGLDV